MGFTSTVKSVPAPTIRLIIVDQGPATLTTTSQSIFSSSPFKLFLLSLSNSEMTTLFTRPDSSFKIEVTALRYRKLAPPCRAASARFCAAKSGSLTYPPTGVKIPPSSSVAGSQNSSDFTGLFGQYLPASIPGIRLFSVSEFQIS